MHAPNRLAVAYRRKVHSDIFPNNPQDQPIPTLHGLIFFLRILRSCSLFIFVIFSSPSQTSPEVGSIRRFSMRTSVDFPLPDKPIITKTSPSFTSNEA